MNIDEATKILEQYQCEGEVSEAIQVVLEQNELNSIAKLKSFLNGYEQGKISAQLGGLNAIPQGINMDTIAKTIQENCSKYWASLLRHDCSTCPFQMARGKCAVEWWQTGWSHVVNKAIEVTKEE